MALSWKYIKKLVNEQVISEFEAEYGKLPAALRVCIIQNNGGRPSLKVFSTKAHTERMFQALLSFNKEDKGNIFSTMEILRDTLPPSVIPFAIDPFGNYIGINKEGNILFLNHETGDVEEVCKTFEEFIENLYE